MADLIDSIHENERKELEDNIQFINHEMKKWDDQNFEPVNYEVTVFKKQQSNEIAAKRNQWESQFKKKRNPAKERQ